MNANVNAGTLEEGNLVGVYIQNGDNYEKSDTVPESGYILNDEESYCKVGEDEIDVTFSYDTSTKTLSVTSITSSGTKCYLYFDEVSLLKDVIPANSVLGTGTPNFANTSCSAGSNAGGNCGEEIVGLYEETTNKGTTYYFRGDVEDNYVEFAGFYWRIIRVNEDGSVRLIYSGNKEEVDAAGKEMVLANGYDDSNTDYKQLDGIRNVIGIEHQYQYNELYDRSEYVGYTYSVGYQRPSDNPSSETDSTIKTYLDNWYDENIGNNPDYDSKVTSNAGFCNDREMASGYEWSSQPTDAFISYAAEERIHTTHQPSFECSNSNDLYMTKVGLITADEVAYAGGRSGLGATTVTNYGYYLYTGNQYWTMTPIDAVINSVQIFTVAENGIINSLDNDSQFSLCPVINLSADVTISSGNGTISSPYVV